MAQLDDLTSAPKPNRISKSLLYCAKHLCSLVGAYLNSFTELILDLAARMRQFKNTTVGRVQEGAIGISSFFGLQWPESKANTRRHRGTPRCLCALCLFGGISLTPAFAESPESPRNIYGEIGLLDMPGGHMAPDGQLSFNVGDISHMQRYALSFQALPWLEFSFRYSHIPNYGGMRSYYDKSFGLKARLLNESQFRPDISIGLRDIVGTGVYASEYIAASKHVGPFDLTAGLGWGRLADNRLLPNPLGEVFSSFNNRHSTNLDVATAGSVDFKRFFRGPNTGIFGGIAWSTPINGVSLIAEYSSDHYTEEAKSGFHTRSPINIGLSYTANETISLGAGWFYGKTFGFTFTIHGDPETSTSSALRLGPTVPKPAIRTDTEQQTALQELHQGKHRANSFLSDGLWSTPNAEQQKAQQILLQALHSGVPGIHSVDLQKKTLIIDARLANNTGVQCDNLAKIVRVSGVMATTIALSDLQVHNSPIVFCNAATTVATANSNNSAVIAESSESNWLSFESNLRSGLAKQDIALKAVSGFGGELWVYYENYRYYFATEAAGRIVRVLMAEAPSNVEIFHLIQANFGIPTRELVVTRSGIERVLGNHLATSDLKGVFAVKAPPLNNPALNAAVPSNYPVLSWSLDPKMAEHVFDPEAPLQFQFYLQGAALVQILPGLVLESVATGNIWTDYTFSRAPDSELPHVRTDLLQYLKQGQYGLASLDLDYRTRLTPTVYAEIKGGLLEDMFAGGGGQLLWRPENKRWALGLDLYQVWQRGYERLFTLRNFYTLTGHVNLYYSSPWYGLNFALHAGRYLAGDYGATLEVTRHFSTGVEVGAWATFTNVPFSRFGEGSFDKGIIVHIPLEWSLPIHSQTSFDFRLNTLTRDGGARLAADDSLYDATLGTSNGEIKEHLDDFVEP